MDLPECHFDGIFANAAPFHVPRQETPTVLRRPWYKARPPAILLESLAKRRGGLER